MIELLVALAIFALLTLAVDAVFVAAHRGARKTDLAAETQQNARIAIDRLSREIRESSATAAPAAISVGGAPGRAAVVFKSARLGADNAIVCLYVRSTDDPPAMSHPDCFTFPDGNLTPPPYRNPQASPLGTYGPIWQRFIGYYLVDAGGGVYNVRRVVGDLRAPDAVLPDPHTLTGGEVVAALVETFDVSLSGTRVTMTLKARGEAIVAGRAVPAQEIRLDGVTLARN